MLNVNVDQDRGKTGETESLWDVVLEENGVFNLDWEYKKIK